jgi:hypothetical protein
LNNYSTTWLSDGAVFENQSSAALNIRLIFSSVAFSYFTGDSICARLPSFTFACFYLQTLPEKDIHSGNTTPIIPELIHADFLSRAYDNFLRGTGKVPSLRLVGMRSLTP